jgi:hypothetical protein
LLSSFSWPIDRRQQPYPTREAVLEVTDQEPGDVRQDVPLSFRLGDRRFGTRKVRRVELKAPRKEKKNVPL